MDLEYLYKKVSQIQTKHVSGKGFRKYLPTINILLHGSRTDIRRGFPNILLKCFLLASWICADIQNFYITSRCASIWRGPVFFLNMDSSRYKELEIGIWPGWLLRGAEQMQKIKCGKPAFEVMGASAACGSIRLVKAL